MAGPARTITPIPRRALSIAPARTIADLNGSVRREAERDMILTKALDGKLNNTGTLTLATGGATTTDIDDARIGQTTLAVLVGIDQNGSASLTTISQSVIQQGKIRLVHTASGLTRTIGYVLFGIVLMLVSSAALAQSPSLVGLPQASDATCVAGEYYLGVVTGTAKWRKCENGVWSDMGSGGGAGEVNTASNLGGGLANWDSKLGVDLRFNSFAAADFDLATNLLTIDAAKWLTITAASAAYQPIDADLSAIALLATTAFGRGLLTEASDATLRATLALVPGTNVQVFDADLLAIAGLVTTTGGRSILATTPADDQVYVGDTASAGTWRSIPDCGEAGTLNYDIASNLFSCLTDAGGGGGGISYADAVAAVLAGF